MQKKKKLYYLLTYGQLGNQLAVLAHLLAFAIEFDYLIVCPKSEYLSQNLSLFQTKQHYIQFSNNLSRPLFTNFIMRAVKLVSVNNNKLLMNTLTINQRFVVENDFSLAHQSSRIVVTDWLFRYYSGIKKHQNSLRKMLAFTPASVSKAADKWEVLKKQYPQSNFIGIHMRRGDYAHWLGGIYYYSNDTYYGWMLQLSELISHAVFIVCSNELIQFKNENNLQIVYANGSPTEDLFLLSQCDYLIGPPSTFSSWAAFIGHKYLYQPDTKEVEMKLDLFQHYYL